MARYSTTIRTELSGADAFAYMVDLRNFERWDPGVQAVTQVDGDGAGPGASFHVIVDAPGGGMTLCYTTTHFDPPRTAIFEARSRMFTSIDKIVVSEEGGSTVVTYDATLELNGPLRFFDPVLRPVFDRIGGRANDGLLEALQGQLGVSADDIVDKVLEVPIVTSFTSIGYHVRSRMGEWDALDSFDMTGRTVVVTGATSGLGRHAAQRFASLGADVTVAGRNADKTERVRDEIAAATGSESLDVAIADMGELDQVRALADSIVSRHEWVDVLVHNAGALSAERQTNADGVEATVASQVLGPFLLTSLLLEPLRRAAPGRVVTVSSGGMYATGLTVAQLQMSPTEYSGSEQYARAKRAQVTLNEMWAARIDPAAIVFQAMHPGWVDTPGVEASLPTFRKIVGPLLRSTEQGADTIVWLGAADEAASSNGAFWLDRRRRSIHKIPTTRRTDTAERRAELWNWCVEQTGAPVD